MPAIRNAKGWISAVATWANFVSKLIQDIDQEIFANFL